jgi:hypothetical protein
MASYKLDGAQRDRLDKMVLDAVRAELTYIDLIVERVRIAMVATREPWAITYSRGRAFKDQVINALRRWREKKRVERGTNPRYSEWRLAPLPAREEMIDAIVARVEDWDLDTLIGVMQNVLRDDLKTQSDDEVVAQWREIVERVATE